MTVRDARRKFYDAVNRSIKSNSESALNCELRMELKSEKAGSDRRLPSYIISQLYDPSEIYKVSCNY